MEIKQGDKVMVSKDAPKVYQKGSIFNYTERQSIVHEVDGDAAIIGLDIEDSPIYSAPIAIPCKYLVKVDAETKEAKFKKGDKVRYIGDIQEHKGEMFVIDGDIFFNDYYKQWQASSIKTTPTGRWSICNVPLSDLEPDTAPAAPKIKVGDRVRNIKSDLCGIALNIEHGIVEVGIPYDKERHYWNTDIVELFEPTEQTEAQKKPYEGISEETANEISNMLEAYAKALSGIADPFDWQRYAADLAKEVALKIANKFNAPHETAEYAVSVAKAVVEGLKRK